jgi:hypothetical protein
MTNILQDPHLVIYDNLFFGLSLGKTDIYLLSESNWISEESVVLRQIYTDRLHELKRILPYHFKVQNGMSAVSKNCHFIKHDGLFFQFIVYSDVTSRKLVGLSIKVTCKSKNVLEKFGKSSEDRLQKIMFLLSRGLLKSYFHRIEYLEVDLIL